MGERKNTAITVKSGATYGLGTMLAICMSWTAHQAVGWALLHGVFSWFYVIYYLIMRDDWTWF